MPDPNERYEELVQLARYQRRIGRVITAPVKSDLKEKTDRAEVEFRARKAQRPGVLARIGGWFGFGWNKALKGIASGFSFIGSWFKKRKVNLDVGHIDMNHIPGYKQDVHFDEIRPDDGPDNQPVINDTRRLPVVWETPVPEPVDEPPTISFAFDQGTEGDERSRTSGGMGHGILRLKYTKINPMTNKPERYSLEMGFYPKGGAISMSGDAAQVIKGLTIPGQLRNDTGHEYSVQKTFTVTNKQINKVLLLAQNYEKDGYNFIRRNCSTFLADSAREAGIDMTELMRQVELSGKKSDVFAASLGGEMFLDMAKHNLEEGTVKTDFAYQRYGGKIVMQDDIQRFNKTEYRIDLKGYTPAHSAEMIRQDENFVVSSRTYTGGLKEKDLAKDLKKEDKRMMQCRNEIGLFEKSIRDVLAKRGIDGTEALIKLHEFNETSLSTVDEMYQRAFNGKSSINGGTDVTETESRQAVHDGTKAIIEYQKGLNEIFAETFGKDKELNIAFQHMSSVLEHMKSSFAEKYRTNMINVPYNSIAGSDSPDTLALRRDFVRATVTLNGTNGFGCTHAQLAAFAQSDGDPENVKKENARVKDLYKKLNNKTISKDEKKELHKLELKLDLRQNFANAQTAYFAKEHFTKPELNYIFNEIREFEHKAGMGDKPKSTSAIMQALALEHVLKGSKSKLQAKLSQMTDAMKTISQNEKDPQKRMEAYGSHLDGVENLIEDVFVEGFGQENAELNDIIEAVKAGVRSEFAMDVSEYENEDEYEKAVSEKASERLFKRVAETYIAGMANELVYNATKEMSSLKNGEALSDAFTYQIEDMTENADSATLYDRIRNAIRSKFGLTPLPVREKAKISKEAIELKELKDSTTPEANIRRVNLYYSKDAKLGVRDYLDMPENRRNQESKERLEEKFAYSIIARSFEVLAQKGVNISKLVEKKPKILDNMVSKAVAENTFGTKEMVDNLSENNATDFLNGEVFRKTCLRALNEGKMQNLCNDVLEAMEPKDKQKEETKKLDSAQKVNDNVSKNTEKNPANVDQNKKDNSGIGLS